MIRSLIATMSAVVLATTPSDLSSRFCAAEPPAKSNTASDNANANGSVKELQGMWKLIAFERDGKAVELNGEQPRIVIKGTKIGYGGQDLADLKANVEMMPKFFDVSVGYPKGAYQGIYELDGKTLKICWKKEEERVVERPSKFATADGDGFRIMVFEREEPKEGLELEGVAGQVGMALRKENDSILVGSVFDGSPANRAGLRADDVLVSIGGMEIKESSIQQIVGILRGAAVGSDTVFVILRNKKKEEIKVKVGAAPPFFIDR